MNDGFLDSDSAILDNVRRLADIPGTVVQGRYDMICPPLAAWRLTERWQRGELKLIPNAGHALSEPGISAELVQVTNRLRRQRAALCL